MHKCWAAEGEGGGGCVGFQGAKEAKRLRG